jgi:hypothetical protein
MTSPALDKETAPAVCHGEKIHKIIFSGGSVNFSNVTASGGEVQVHQSEPQIDESQDIEVKSIGGQGSLFRLTGPKEDWLTQGKTLEYRPENDSFVIESTKSRRTISFEILDKDELPMVSLELSKGKKGRLTKGKVKKATRDAIFSDLKNGFDLTVDSQGCNRILASYQIDRIQWNPDGGIKTFEIHFKAQCDDGPPASGYILFLQKK